MVDCEVEGGLGMADQLYTGYYLHLTSSITGDTHREPASGTYDSVVMHSPGSLLDLGIPTHNHVPTGRG